ncbi:MAG: molecular chaperone DnaJ [Rhodospirillales bacterium]|nr:molecular chaperone DnaJ [Alphaproteobacteria bacterium]MBL6948187.1 molecular chaperone DnaJ [Rhodospirillales bacterium]
MILGLAILAGLLLAGRWFTTADPKLLVKVLKWTLLGVIGTVALFFLFTGRLAWAIFALPALLPWLMRARAAHRMFKTFSRMTSGWSGAAAGQSSDVETRFLRMALDHSTGRMSGEVIDGDYTGRALAGMSLEELMDLLQTCRVEDQPSAAVLEAYLEREHPDWRDHVQDAAPGAGDSGGAESQGSYRGSGSMTRGEALDILGLESGAGVQEIKDAHRRLISGLHPDHGGSSYLAAKINRAKDVLLGKN